ncbi:MAG: tetratricopeptide repeat protein [Candidatus Xenobiia bacterium LiM19]
MKKLRENPLFSDGIRALYQGGFEEASSFFIKLLSRGIEGEERAGALYFLGKSRAYRGDPDGAVEAFGSAEKDITHDSPLKLYCTGEIALLRIKKGDREGAYELLESMSRTIEKVRKKVSLSEKEPDSSGPFNTDPYSGAQALYLHYRAIYEVRFGEKSTGHEMLKAALGIFLAGGFREESSMVYDSLGQQSFEKGDLEEALYSFRESLRIKEETGDRYGLAITWGNMGRAYLAMADYDEALHYFEKDLDYARSAGDRYGEMVMLNNTGRTRVLMGDFDGGKSNLEKSLDIAVSISSRLWETLNRKDLATASLECGEINKAEQYLDAIRQFVDTNGSGSLKAEMCMLESQRSSQKGDREKALALCRDAASLYQELEIPHELIRTHMRLGTLYLEGGERDKALEVFEDSLERAERLKAPWLVKAFEKLIHSVGEEEWIRIRLRRYLGREVLDEVLTGAEQSALGGTRQKVTILVSDIRGYTEYSEHRNPEEIVAMLNDYFSLMVDVIVEQKGTIDKFIGDAIMSYFGAPITYGDDSTKAVKAAQGMMEALEKYNRIRAQNKEAPIKMGIGIATGEAVVGNIGSYRRRDFTVVGHTVSKAFVLCSRAKSGQILTSESTWEENGEVYSEKDWHCHAIKGENIYEFLWDKERAQSQPQP